MCFICHYLRFSLPSGQTMQTTILQALYTLWRFLTKSSPKTPRVKPRQVGLLICIHNFVRMSCACNGWNGCVCSTSANSLIFSACVYVGCRKFRKEKDMLLSNPHYQGLSTQTSEALLHCLGKHEESNCLQVDGCSVLPQQTTCPPHDGIPFFMSHCFFSQMLNRRPGQLSLLLARFIYYVHLPADFTVDPFTFAFPTAKSGPFEDMYIVSLHGYKKKFFSIHSPDELTVWIDKNLSLLQQGYLVGGWLNAEYRQYYLDVSTIIYGYENAMKFAELNFQKAIYYPFKNKVIPANPGKTD